MLVGNKLGVNCMWLYFVLINEVNVLMVKVFVKFGIFLSSMCLLESSLINSDFIKCF